MFNIEDLKSVLREPPEVDAEVLLEIELETYLKPFLWTTFNFFVLFLCVMLFL